MHVLDAANVVDRVDEHAAAERLPLTLRIKCRSLREASMPEYGFNSSTSNTAGFLPRMATA